MRIDISQLQALWKQAFGDPEEFIQKFFQTGFDESRCRCLFDGDRLTAMLFWFDCLCRGGKVAYLYAIATDKAYRGKGLCRQLMEQTHRDLQASGYLGAILVPAEEGLFSLYEKLGYTPCCPMDKVTVEAAGNVAITPISPVTHFNTRLELLPRDAAILRQGLDFLLTYNGFYKADGCLFCAALEKDTVYFQEFLGDPQKLPAIIAALGGKTGKLRLPGSAPFAMYRGFTPDPPPSYFNLPMD